MNVVGAVIPDSVELESWPSDLSDVLDSGHDAVVLFLPRPLAGLGTTRHLAGLAAGLQESGVRTVYVGPASTDGPSLLANPVVDVPVVGDTTSTYTVCAEAMDTALRQLAANGVQQPLIVTLGYTAFGPDAVRRAMPMARRSGIRRVTVVLVDSAFPDTDAMDTDVDDDGWPLGRFYRDSYRGMPDLTVLFALTSAYSFEPRVLAARCPPVSGVGVIAPPYRQEYIDSLQETTADATSAIYGLWPEVGQRRRSDVVIPLVSSDIWSPDSVGAFMTAEQYETVLMGTETIVRGLGLIARRRGGRVLLPVDESARWFLEGKLGQSLSDVNADTGVIPLYYSDLDQAVHAQMLASSDLAVSRTGGQANASVVLALCGTPSVIIDMPARGYMQAELSSMGVEWIVDVDQAGLVTASRRPSPLGWFGQWSMSDEEVADIVRAALAEDRSVRPSRSARAFEELRSSPSGNLFSLIAAATAERSSISV